MATRRPTAPLSPFRCPYLALLPRLGCRAHFELLAANARGRAYGLVHLLLRREPRLLGSESRPSVQHHHPDGYAAVLLPPATAQLPPSAAALSRPISLSRTPLLLARDELAAPAGLLPRVQRLVLSPAHALSSLHGHPAA